MLNQIQFGSRGLYCVASGREGGIKRSSDVYFLRLSGVTLQTGWIKDLLKTFNSLFSRLLSWKDREQGVAVCLSCSLYIYLSFSLQHLLHFSSQQYLKLFSHFFSKPLILTFEFRQNWEERKDLESLFFASLEHTITAPSSVSVSLWCAGCQLWRSSIVSWTSTCRCKGRPQQAAEHVWKFALFA